MQSDFLPIVFTQNIPFSMKNILVIESTPQTCLSSQLDGSGSSCSVVESSLANAGVSLKGASLTLTDSQPGLRWGKIEHDIEKFWLQKYGKTVISQKSTLLNMKTLQNRNLIPEKYQKHQLAKQDKYQRTAYW